MNYAIILRLHDMFKKYNLDNMDIILMGMGVFCFIIEVIHYYVGLFY